MTPFALASNSSTTITSQRKYRQAEQLIAEESKDDFYLLSKPELQNYRIGNIEYSEKFTKAKVVIVGAMPVLLPMAGGKIMDMPFASYWKIENGLWCWYYNKDSARHTPFGDVKVPSDTKPGMVRRFFLLRRM